VDDIALLHRLGVNLATLDQAPEQPRTADARTRYGLPCSTCGAPAVATTTVTVSASSRWLDSCRDHMIAAARLRSAA
jgi:hypothetical protein